MLLVALVTGAGTFALMMLLDALAGRRPVHLLIGLLFGTSWILISSNQWFAAAGSTLAASLTAATCWGYVVWLRRRSRAAYWLALIATCLAVGSGEQALAIPLFLSLLYWCFLSDEPPRRAMTGIVPFGGVAVCYLAFVQIQPWHKAYSLPSVTAWARLLAAMTFRGLAPTTVGSAMFSGPPTARDWISALAPCIALVGLAVAARRRFHWQSILFFAAGAFVVSAPVAVGRLSELSPEVAGTTPRYLAFLPLVLAVAVACSVAPKRARVAMTFVCIVLLACYSINLGRTYELNSFARDNGRAAAAIAQNIRAGLADLQDKARIVDTTLPYPVWYPQSGPFSALSRYWGAAVPAIGQGPNPVAFDPTGSLRPVTFHPGVGDRHEPLYVRVTVSGAAGRALTVRVAGDAPTATGRSYRLRTEAGKVSFILPSWSTSHVSASIDPPANAATEVGTIAFP